MEPLSAKRPWIGKLFLLLGAIWFAGVFYVMRPDQPHLQPRPVPTVKLADGKTYRVYLPYEVLGSAAGWVENINPTINYTTQDFVRRPLIRFMIVALGPPFAALMGSLIWLGISEIFHRRRYLRPPAE